MKQARLYAKNKKGKWYQLARTEVSGGRPPSIIKLPGGIFMLTARLKGWLEYRLVRPFVPGKDPIYGSKSVPLVK